MSAILEFILKLLNALNSRLDRWNASLEETNRELDKVEEEIEQERFQKGSKRSRRDDNNPMFKKIDTSGGFWETIRRR